MRIGADLAVAGMTLNVSNIRPSRRSARLALPADLTAPAKARAATEAVLRRWGLRHLLDTVLLAVSEMVTNAVRHGRPPVTLDVRLDGERLSVGVHDGDAALPPDKATPAADDAEGGRGLLIIDALSDGTGARLKPPQGKVTWAVFHTRG